MFLKEEIPGNEENLYMHKVYLRSMSTSLYGVSTILYLLSLLPPPPQYYLVYIIIIIIIIIMLDIRQCVVFSILLIDVGGSRDNTYIEYRR